MSAVARTAGLGAPSGLTRTPAGDAVTELVLRTFRLNGLFLEVAERIARPAGLTAAWWQVLGAALSKPLTIAGIAREMGLARQSVQRIADLLVARGLAEYAPNPAHRRAKLFVPTEAGRAAIDRLRDDQRAWADTVGAAVGEAQLRRALATLEHVDAELTRATVSSSAPGPQPLAATESSAIRT
jgi:DNA-binding MarR family transcriptional regulator